MGTKENFNGLLEVLTWCFALAAICVLFALAINSGPSRKATNANVPTACKEAK